MPQIYVFQSQIHERFGERPSERLLQIHVFNYMKTLKLIPGKSYVIYFYKATKVWLGLVCLLACACVCACVCVCVGCYLDGRREVLLMIIDGFCFARHALCFSKVRCFSSCFTATTSSFFSAVLGDDTGCSVATTCNVCACEYVEVYEGENNLKLHVSQLLSEHILSFLNEGERWPSFFSARYAPVDCVEY